ncbi:MAG: GNAT family N-acetyltransferase [Proteobacteria bacterium]|nr:GNAT family N-acetyltransferase [Pseudomonadota bacterium]
MTRDSDLSIRRATQDDALRLHAVATQVFLETYATEGVTDALAREAEDAFSLRAFSALIAQPRYVALLAERQGHLVAFADLERDAAHTLVPERPATELRRLYVQSPFLRQRIGSRLIAAAELLAREDGARVLWLTAWSGNDRARSFYAARGYADRGITHYEFGGQCYENRVLVYSLQLDP